MIVAAVLAIEVHSLVTLSRWVQHTDDVIATAREVQSMLIDRESTLRGYVIARSPEYLELYQAVPGAGMTIVSVSQP